MHPTNVNWWIYAAGRWVKYLHKAKVIELGSYNVNGSIRPMIASAGVESYIGVDWREGPDVNKVFLVHELRDEFPRESFGAIVSASMLEHDPHWKQSLECMHWLLENSGVLLISWGAIRNPSHELHSAPDGNFHSRPAAAVVNKLVDLGFYIQEFRYERRISFNRHLIIGRVMPGAKKSRKPTRAPGCVALAAFKSPLLLEPPTWIDPYERGDEVA